MRSQLLLVGLNHRTADVAVREQLAIPSRELEAVLTTLHRDFAFNEVVVLSTCNRVEYYVVSSRPAETLSALQDFLSHRSHLAPEAIHPHLYIRQGDEVIQHVFRVAAGLDSMIFGESEITAQVKQAYAAALQQGTTGPALNRLFQKALHATKIIRSQTKVAEGQASIGSVVATLARQLFGERLASCEVLLWGAGKAAEATTKHLVASGISRLWIVNRTQAKAQELASRCQGDRLCEGGWLSWERALSHLQRVDIAIVCTQAPHYVIDHEDIKAVAALRRARPLCVIDLAVPRNVDPSLKSHPGIHLYNIDDLQAIAAESLTRRQEEVAQCEALIAQQVAYCRRGTSINQQGDTCLSRESLVSV
ncbi:MAG: glutamyl-tRNA reductase [Candidatus Omnitrophica bacterium]|nr:glutamyl-tRNA reductase [Candidatus Omnitrophota bacterium]